MARATQKDVQTGQLMLSHGYMELYQSKDVALTRAMELMTRFIAHDWGILDDQDKERNEAAVARKEAVYGRYDVALPGDSTARVLIKTDPGHLVTTILLPDEI